MQCAISNGAVLIIEDINLYLHQCHKEFFEALTELTEVGGHAVLTTQGKPEDADLRRLAAGNVVWVGAEAEPLTFHTWGVESMVEKKVLSPHHNRAPLGRLYPELSGIPTVRGKAGSFVLRTPLVVRTGLVVPPPTSITA